MNKYHNKKITVDGKTFDSKKEYNRYRELSLLERAGQISNLRWQVKYILIPAQYEQTKERYKSGQRKGELKQGRMLERECAYMADFEYIDNNGQKVVEDTKGVKTKDYIIKRKLMLWRHNIKIREV